MNCVSPEADAARYRLIFDLADHEALGHTFFPEVSLIFDLSDTDRHHHVRFRCAPLGYPTCLGR